MKVKDRNILLDQLPRNMKIAELGVFCGEYSKILKEKLSPSEFYLVDTFPSEMWCGDKDGNNMICKNLENVYTELVTEYENDSTVKVFKTTSVEFLSSLPDEYLDMVYIDTVHTYEHVKEELKLSLLKVRKGGIIAGHDYSPHLDGVIQAVDEFCKEHNRKISLLTEDGCPTYIIFNEEMPDIKKVSLITACKDRNDCLQAVLPSWLQHKEVDEVIIVDWSSSNSLKHLTNIDSRIKVVRVENEKYYIPSHANNLAASLASNDYILRLDTDYFLNPYYNFFSTYPIGKNSFVSGEPQNYNDRVNNPYYKYLFGLLYISKENFYKVNGYNESIGYYYSYEDGDMFDRLKLAGLTQIRLQNNHSVIHIPHSDKKRYENFQGAKVLDGSEQVIVDTHISINQQTYKNPKEYFVPSKVSWQVNQVSNNFFVATKNKNVIEDFPVVNCISLEECESRRSVLIDSFKKYNIDNVRFLLSKRYSESDDKIEGKHAHTLNEGTAGCCVSHLKNIKQWLETSNDEYGFFCEDDLSLETVQYWDKTWKEFIDNLPQDWDCIQLLTIRKDKLSLSIRERIWDDWSATAYILKRSYAEKIISNYYIEETFKLELPEPNSGIQPLIENLLFTIGKTYTVSLFVENINFESTFVETDTDVDAATLHKNNHIIAAQKTLSLWRNKVKGKQTTAKELYEYSTNIDDPECNFKMGEFYFHQGHTAPALSFFLRCAERTDNKLLAYEALIYGYMCYREQKIRDETAKSLIMHALCLLPERPEARWILSVFFEQKSEWMYAYYHACQGLETSDREFEPLKYYKEYPGKVGLLFQKAIVGYWWGKNDECKNILIDLRDNHQLTDTYKQGVLDNLKRLGIEGT
jgi:GR25 family glycosyltransferase involved in LPS biosynthesis